MIQLRAKDLCVGYNFHPVIKGINFEIQYGDYVCVVGGNGAGKSTLIKTILGLNAPISGKIKYDKGTTSSSIGYLQQHLDVQSDFPASVYEIVLSGCIGSLGFRFFYGKKEKEKANEALKTVGIYDLKNSSYKKLSGGQQQRVLIARALCAASKMIILDEPFVGLDQKMIEQLKEVIHHINKDLGITIIMITHNFFSNSDDTTKVLELKHESASFYTKEEYIKETGGVVCEHDHEHC